MFHARVCGEGCKSLANNGIFILSELAGEGGRLIAEIQREFDPKLAATRWRPHITIVGSSGTGPILAGTTIQQLRDAIEPVAATTPAMNLRFGAPMRFMQTNIVVLPLDPHGPLRILHDRLAQSGLTFERPRFTFSPHATLSLYPTLSREAIREILTRKIDVPAELDSIAVYRTSGGTISTLLLEFPLTGPAAK